MGRRIHQNTISDLRGLGKIHPDSIEILIFFEELLQEFRKKSRDNFP